jgi:integrase
MGSGQKDFDGGNWRSCQTARETGEHNNDADLKPPPSANAAPRFYGHPSPVHVSLDSCCVPTVLAFVEHRFVPEFVAMKRPAGRAYFQAILKHIITPEQVDRLFGINHAGPKGALTAKPGWPYLDSLLLCEVTAETIEYLTSNALKLGYSTQTAAHIQNVVRAILSHAIRSGAYSGMNPATLAKLPAITRKKSYTLTLSQLKDLLQAMRNPEKELAIFAMLTEMNVAEICGLQWKYINLSSLARMVDGEIVPPRTIAIRMQCYRGDFDVVPPGRIRFNRISELLASFVQELKTRKLYTGPDDFVLVSRNGTPVHPENIAARRLKPIGRTFEMPWLSWCVFHRTRDSMRTVYGRNMHEEIKKIIPLP